MAKYLLVYGGSTRTEAAQAGDGGMGGVVHASRRRHRRPRSPTSRGLTIRGRSVTATATRRRQATRSPRPISTRPSGSRRAAPSSSAAARSKVRDPRRHVTRRAAGRRTGGKPPPQDPHRMDMHRAHVHSIVRTGRRPRASIIYNRWLRGKGLAATPVTPERGGEGSHVPDVGLHRRGLRRPALVAGACGSSASRRRAARWHSTAAGERLAGAASGPQKGGKLVAAIRRPSLDPTFARLRLGARRRASPSRC
jgi:hypothetical protein